MLRVAFPTDFLSTETAPGESKPSTWIAAAPLGKALIVEMFFTFESKGYLLEEFAKIGERSLVCYTDLSSAEAFAIASSVSEWDNRNLRVPASLHEKKDLIFSTIDPDRTGRPVRITMFNLPKDGDALICQELGGFRASTDDPRFRGITFDTLTREQATTGTYLKNNSKKKS